MTTNITVFGCDDGVIVAGYDDDVTVAGCDEGVTVAGCDDDVTVAGCDDDVTVAGCDDDVQYSSSGWRPERSPHSDLTCPICTRRTARTRIRAMGWWT